MKKFIRFVALIVLLCISLSGCSYLDELRATRGVLTEDGAIVMFDGTKYLPLPENEYFCPDFSCFFLLCRLFKIQYYLYNNRK